ncbi:MAG TPA: hypothetical protein DD734_03690 [Firmicutes bacterium]|nr:hypothetical protein [Bacillota bacterium]
MDLLAKILRRYCYYNIKGSKIIDYSCLFGLKEKYCDQIRFLAGVGDDKRKLKKRGMSKTGG